ncbi:Intradiol ring-cleavage dioxygenase [Boletus reticuloceps]|uniref:Intradiol ring-cleavage dioxygenase n=1 Tax=Boletus reticuloceps TaxID=495285 RepID=A0A8I2YQT4_9AGAM|nr:Intradiol ring-cleavage dioxygenase [Boletus reticuloceps]
MAHGDFDKTQDNAQPAVSNGIPPPSFPLPLPDSPDIITANLLLLIGQTPNPRLKFIYQLLVKHLHAFVKESNLSTDEWMAAIQFLTLVGQTCTPLRQEMILLSDVLGVSALVDALNNPVMGGATENSVLGPFFTEDAEDIEHGGSIASEGKGEYMYVEGRVLTTEGEPIAGAVIETWEADDNGYYDTQYADRTHPDCRGRLHTAKDGSFGYRAIVPHAYPIPGDGPIGGLLISQGRHNMRPNHLHMMAEAPGYHKLITSLYPDSCDYIASDTVFGVKKSLVVKLEQVDDDAEARKRGFPKGGSFKLLKRDIVLLTEEQSRLTRRQVVGELEASYLQTKDN